VNDSIIGKGTIFLWSMFKLNLFVATSNIVLIVLVLTIPFHLVTIPLYVVGVYLLILSLLAMFSTLKRMADKGSAEKLQLWQLYIRGYSQEFKGSVLFALWYVLGVLVLYSAFLGMPFVPDELRFLPLYTMVAILLYVHFVFALLIRVNFILGLKGIWRLGAYLISRHPMYALFIFGGTLIAGALMNMLPILIVLGAVPAAGYLLTIATRKLFGELERKLTDKPIDTQKEEDT